MRLTSFVCKKKRNKIFRILVTREDSQMEAATHQLILLAYARKASDHAAHRVIVNGPRVLAQCLFHLGRVLQSRRSQNAASDIKGETIKYLCGTLLSYARQSGFYAPIDLGSCTCSCHNSIRIGCVSVSFLPVCIPDTKM